MPIKRNARIFGAAGQVNFCDASAPHCTDIHILGSSALNSSGAATYTFVPGPGAHSYQARFVEDGFGLASASSVASLNVGPAPNPVYSDTAAISLNGGAPGDYSIIATVTGYGGTASPTGIVSFVDTSFGNNVLATASLGTGIPGIGFLESSSPSFGSYPASEVTADYNGDGIPDLAIISSDSSSYGGPFTVAVFLGNGDGTFRAGPTIQPSGMQVYPFMISGDFNGDRKQDLAILTWGLDSASYLTMLLGNGDGSFTAKPTVVAVSQPNEGGDGIPGTMAAADFNGDGKLDLAVVGDYISNGGVGILLGNGDGTFNAATILAQDQDFGLVAIGDFNGDGIPDMVVTHYFEDGAPPNIFLGKGDGTFTAPNPASFTLAYFPTSIVVGDFNGDGILDLAFSDLNGVEIALGNGDGTFNETSASPIAVPSELYSLQAGDFNHDGKLDLAGLDNYFDQIDLLLGAGDGTFAVTATTPVVSTVFVGPFQIAAADFNGDGVPDLAMLTKNVNTASILLTEPTETATATVNGIAPVGAGTHNVDASYPGDRHYSAVTSSTIPLIAALAPLAVTPAAGTYTSPQTLTISEAIPGSTIYYELTGIVSTNGYVQYTGPVALPYGGVETLQAYATETGYNQSNYLLAQYTINIPSIAPGPGGTTSLTVTPGTTTANTGTISVAGTNGFSGIVNLTCSVTTTLTSVSDMPTCSLNPTSVTISGASAQTSTLTVNTTAASSAENRTRSLFWPSASGAMFALALLFVSPRKPKERVALIGLLLLFVSTGFIGCGGGSIGGGGGGGNGGTTPGAYTITVTGRSGSLSATVGAVALTVR